MNWVINIAETEVFHNKFTKKIKKVVILFSTLTSSHLYDHSLEKTSKNERMQDSDIVIVCANKLPGTMSKRRKRKEIADVW